jgi:transposase
LDEHGKKVKEFEVIGSWDKLIEEVAKLPRPMAVCFEASTGCGWLCDRLLPLACRVEVAHPGHLRLIYRAKKKNDRIDAHKLATLLFLGQVPRAYIPDAAIRGWRGLVEFRCRTVQQRTRAKNALRTLLRGCGIQNLLPSPRKGLWAKKGLAVLRELELPTPQDRLRRDLLMDELDQLNRQVKRIEQELDRIAADHAGVALLKSIPGVGSRTAEAVLAYVDKPHRFDRNKQVGAYFGLVPCQDSSSDVNRLGHITRQGPATVRGLIMEAAWQGIRRSETLKAFYERVRQGKKERTKIALVAAAHHLLRVMLSMLKSGEVWREAKADAAATAETPRATAAAWGCVKERPEYKGAPEQPRGVESGIQRRTPMGAMKGRRRATTSHQ